MSKKQFIKKQNTAVGCLKRAKTAKRDFLYASRQKQYLRSCRTSFINSLSLFVYAVSNNALASQLAALPAAASKVCRFPVCFQSQIRMEKKHLLQRQRTARFPQRKIAGTERQHNHANSAAPVRRKKMCSERKLHFPKVFCSENAAERQLRHVFKTSSCAVRLFLSSAPFTNPAHSAKMRLGLQGTAMDFGDILDQWDAMQKTERQKQKSVPQVSHKKANAPTREEKEHASLKKHLQTPATPTINPQEL